ncbi:MAG: hypothetical protein HY927_06810 [Elusimicrobia bacterium]|nr:hypothetical protein [Elusimicrobiota bacterium]
MNRVSVALFGLVMLLIGMALSPVESASQGKGKKRITVEWLSSKTEPNLGITYQPIKTGGNEKADWATCEPPAVAVGIFLDGKGGGKLACAQLTLETAPAAR